MLVSTVLLNSNFLNLQLKLQYDTNNSNFVNFIHVQYHILQQCLFKQQICAQHFVCKSSLSSCCITCMLILICLCKERSNVEFMCTLVMELITTVQKVVNTRKWDKMKKM